MDFYTNLSPDKQQTISKIIIHHKNLNREKLQQTGKTYKVWSSSLMRSWSFACIKKKKTSITTESRLPIVQYLFLTLYVLTFTNVWQLRESNDKMQIEYFKVFTSPFCHEYEHDVYVIFLNHILVLFFLVIFLKY